MTCTPSGDDVCCPPSGPDAVSAAAWVPSDPSLGDLTAAVPGCRGCGLYATATHPVMGAGPVPARVMVVGVQPLRTEDRLGRPFVGRAGMLLRRALADAGIDPETVFFTNALKHTQKVTDDPATPIPKPETDQMRRCLPWLRAELLLVRPRVVISLGRVPGEALFGSGFASRQHRGTALDLPRTFGLDPAPTVVVTARPTSVQKSRQRREHYARLVQDLEVARDHSLY